MSMAYTTSILIQASPEKIYDYFIKPELLVQWMGEYARLEAVEGGIFSVDIDGVLIRGNYTLIERPYRIEVSWGEAGNALMPPGATGLVITFEPQGSGTLVKLSHSGLVPGEAEKHAFGWPIFMSRLAVVATGGEPGPYPWAGNKTK